VSKSDRIELTSDGVRDHLTGALAPARFLEIVRAELSMANRESRVVTLISIRLAEPSSSEVEDALILFATSTASLLRTGDQCGRISEYGFWILLRGDQESSRVAAERFLAPHNADQWIIDYCESEPGEDIKNLLRRMDAIHFTNNFKK